jgi:hypothetical protein
VSGRGPGSPVGAAGDPGERGGGAAVRRPWSLLVSVLALGAVAALLVLRGLDDDRLTSWQWVFAGVNPLRLYGWVVVAIAVANLLARAPLPGRRPGAVLFLAASGVAACFWGEPEVLVDAARYFTQAKHLEVHGLRSFLSGWGNGIPAWTDLPLAPLLYGLVFQAFGESRIAIQALGTLLFAGSAVLTQRIGASLWDEETGFAAGALLLAIPYLPTQVPAMLVDVPTMFFFALAVLAVLRAVQEGGAARVLLAAVAVFLSALTKYSTWPLLSVVPAVAIVHRVERRPKALARGAAVLLASGALVLAAVAARHEVFARQVSLLLGYQAAGLRRWGESPVSTFLFQVHPFLTAAAVASVVLAARRRDPRWAIAAWPVLVLLALQARRIRYLLPAFPMLALLGAYGLRTIREAVARRLVLACAVTCSLAVALVGYLPFLRSTSASNLRAAGEWLDGLPGERVEVMTPSPPDPVVNPAMALPLLDLYTSKRLVHVREEAPPPPPSGVETSALRFTWEWVDPPWYAPDGAGPAAAVLVVSDDLDRPLPADLARRLEGLRLDRTFAASEGVFQYRTLVAAYRPPALQERAAEQGRADDDERRIDAREGHEGEARGPDPDPERAPERDARQVRAHR